MTEQVIVRIEDKKSKKLSQLTQLHIFNIYEDSIDQTLGINLRKTKYTNHYPK